MDCRSYRKQYKAFLEDTLGERETERLLRHLAECEPCREELRIHYLLVEGLRRLESGGTFDINSDFEYMLSKRRNLAGRARVRRFGGYAALCVAVGAAYYLMLRGVFL